MPLFHLYSIERINSIKSVKSSVPYQVVGIETLQCFCCKRRIRDLKPDGVFIIRRFIVYRTSNLIAGNIVPKR